MFVIKSPNRFDKIEFTGQHTNENIKKQHETRICWSNKNKLGL